MRSSRSPIWARTRPRLIVANPHLVPGVIKTPVQTTQIASTILGLLGLDPQTLQAVRIEKTQALPGVELKQ
jgi:hypothetical protein